jgi:cell division protein FtsB
VSTSDSVGTDTAGSPAARGPRRAPGGLTGRAAVLGLVVCALVLSLAYPAKEFLAQRGEIGRLRDEQRQAQARVSALEERKRQLADPAYVRAQARARLHYVLPGETVYVVVPPSGSGTGDGATPDVPEVSQDGSWYGRLWGTVRAADGSAP